MNVKVLFLFICISINVKSFTIYVSIKTGDDKNIGSLNSPLKTIQQALNLLEPGDTCLIKEGVYYESLKLKNSGTKENPIIIKNYLNDKVIVKNLIRKNEWIKHENNIYKTKISSKILQVFFEEKPEMKASFPSIEEGEHTTEAWLNSTANTDKTILLTKDFPFVNNDNIQFCGIFGNGLIAIGGKVISKNNNSIKIENDSWYWGDAYKTDYLGSGKCFLTGAYSFLDKAGEWYTDSNYFYTIPKYDDTNNLKKIELRQNYYVLNVQDQSYIQIEGITFFGGSLNLNNAENCVINKCQIDYITPYFDFTYGYTANMDSIKNGHGILITGKYNSIISTKISNSWGDGITANGENITIENCIISNCDWMGIDCAPIYIGGNNITIKNNTIKNTGRSLIVHGIKNSKITNNKLSHFGLLNNDLGAIYSYGADGQNTEISYNFISKSKAKNGVGIYLDNGCKNYSVHHNIVTFCNVGITLNKPGTNYKIYNNTLYKNNFSMGSWGPGQYLINTQTFNNLTDNDNRLKWNYQAFYGTKLDSNYIYKSSIFEDPYNNNFSLKPFSYPIDRGIITEELKVFKGKRPDLGAIELDCDTIKYGSNLPETNNVNSIPLAPINFINFKKDSNLIYFKWEYPYKYFDGFKIRRKKSNLDYIEIITLDSTHFSFIDTLNEIGEYRYHIIAYNKLLNSEESNSIEIFHDYNTKNIFLNAENNDNQKNINIEKDKITYTDNNDWICYKNIKLENYNRIKTRYAVPCENSGQEVQLRIDDSNGDIIGKFVTSSTKSYDSLSIFDYEIDTLTGIHDIYIKFRGSYGIGNFDWFELYKSNEIIKNKKDESCTETGMGDFYSSIIYPNPTVNLVSLSYFSNEITSIEIKIYNEFGKIMYDYSKNNLSPGTNEIKINEFEKLMNGIYILNCKIYSKNKIIETKNHKILKI